MTLNEIGTLPVGTVGIFIEIFLWAFLVGQVLAVVLVVVLIKTGALEKIVNWQFKKLFK